MPYLKFGQAGEARNAISGHPRTAVAPMAGYILLFLLFAEIAAAGTAPATHAAVPRDAVRAQLGRPAVAAGSFVAGTENSTGCHPDSSKARYHAVAQESVPAQAETRQERDTPIYQSWYFYLALLFLGITLPAELFRRRMMLMKGRIGIILEERSRIARECHDTLMAGFAAISWQLEATAKLFRDSGLDATPAAESCELARSMVSHCQAEARRIIWDLRETDEITSVLSQALARTMAANQLRGGIETKLEVEGEEVPLAPGCVHHLTCIAQEAVTNAIRHARPAQILVHLQYEKDALCLSVRDDGCGYQTAGRAAERHGHFGIATMQERASKVGGAFRIQPLPGAGTEVMVRVSFNAMQQPAGQGQQIIRWIGI